MADIRFYHLTKTALERALPPLMVKLAEAGHRAVMLFENEDKLKQLDAQMWTWKQLEFLPHATFADPQPERQPLYLTLTEENPNKADALIVIGNVIPKTAGDYAFCIDMFDGVNETDLVAARARYKHYKQDSANTLTYNRQDDEGKWEKVAA